MYVRMYGGSDSGWDELREGGAHGRCEQNSLTLLSVFLCTMQFPCLFLLHIVPVRE